MRIFSLFIAVVALCIGWSLRALEWKAVVDEQLTAEQAKAAAMPDWRLPEGGEARGTFTLGDYELYDLEQLTGRTMPRQSKALMVTTIEADRDEVAHYNLSANWVSQLYVNGELAFDSGEAGNILMVDRVGRRIEVPLRKGTNHIALLVTRVAAFQTWTVAFWRQPELNGWPLERQLRDELYQQLFPAPETPSLRFRPWIHKLSCDHAEIGVRLDSRVACAIRYRVAGSTDDFTTQWDTCYGRRQLNDLHRFVLDGLVPDTEYEYEVIWLDGKNKQLPKLVDGRFHTYPAGPKPFTFFVFSDLQTLNRAAFIPKQVKERQMQKEGTFIVSLGDMESSFDNFAQRYFDGFLEILADNGCTRPFVPVRGNHEYRGGETEEYGRTFGRPYYAFTCGEVFFFVLDTGEDGYGFSEYRMWSDVKEHFREQAAWLEATLASEDCKKARRHVVLAHATPFEFENTTYASGIRSFAGEAFFGDNPKCKLDLWICGDTHEPYRWDPLTKERIGALREKPREMTQWDREQVTFPVVVNDGPRGAGSEFAVIRVDVDENGNFTLTSTNYDDVVADKVTLAPGTPFQVHQTTYQKF